MLRTSSRLSVLNEGRTLVLKLLSSFIFLWYSSVSIISSVVQRVSTFDCSMSFLGDSRFSAIKAFASSYISAALSLLSGLSMPKNIDNSICDQW